MSSVKVDVVQLPHAADLPLPKYATVQSAAVDLLAAVTEDVVLTPGARTLIPTGLAIALPDGYEAQVRPRSGLALKNGITLLNTPGTIDADYRGNVGVVLFNHGDEDLEEKRNFYETEIQKDSIALHELTTNPKTQEKFAREKYFMKKDNEDVIVIIEEDE